MVGHQISYLTARRYDAPFTKANVPAGYIQSNANDMLKWLQFLVNNQKSLLDKPKQRIFSGINGIATGDAEETVYSFGWYIKGNLLYHTGMNPSFSSYVAIDLQSSSAVAVMANVNSNVTFKLGEQIINQLAQSGTFSELYAIEEVELFDTFDRIFLIFSVFVLSALLVLIYKNYTLDGLSKINRLSYKALSFILFLTLGLGFVFANFSSFVIGISWDTFNVWVPSSFWFLAVLIYVLLLLCLILFSRVFYKRYSTY